MAHVTRERTGTLLRSLFTILFEYPDGLQAGDALEALENRATLTEYERGDYDAGGNRMRKIVRFATIDCARAGWMEKHKGKWSITDAGRIAYDTYTDPAEFYRQATRLYREWKASQKEDEETEVTTSEEVDDHDSRITFEAAEEQAWEEIENHLRTMPPYDFQDLVAALLRAMGYHVTWVSPPGKDGGIDILAYGDPLGTRPPRIKVQVKRYAQKISVDGLRSFMALLSDDDVGLFVTTGGFTRDAHDEARTQEKRKITLVDLQRLFDLWVQHYDKLKESDRRRLPLEPIYFLAPEG